MRALLSPARACRMARSARVWERRAAAAWRVVEVAARAGGERGGVERGRARVMAKRRRGGERARKCNGRGRGLGVVLLLLLLALLLAERRSGRGGRGGR